MLILDQFMRENSKFLPLKIVNFGTKIQIDYFESVFINFNFLDKK